MTGAPDTGREIDQEAEPHTKYGVRSPDSLLIQVEAVRVLKQHRSRSHVINEALREYVKRELSQAA